MVAKRFVVLFISAVIMGGCATQQPIDYTAFKSSKPRSILVLPPLNNTNDVNATAGVFAQVSKPIAESGYYVFPPSLIEETFRQNGVTTPADAHSISPAKLKEIYGADSVLYITITQYGSTYTVLNSVVTVAANAKLVDLRSGDVLWQGVTRVNEDAGNSQGGLLGALVSAVVTQIANNISDRSYVVAGRADEMLLSAGHKNSLLFGPRSPKYGSD